MEEINQPASPGFSVQVPKAIERILVARGVSTQSDFDRVVYPQLRSIRDPNTLTGAPRAIERLIQAFEAGESVCLYGDYDLDGTSGLALAQQFLRGLGFQSVQLYQPDRFKEGYGLHNAAIAQIKTELKCHLIVSIDLGITAIEQAQTARDLGIDLIITDHHLPVQASDGKIQLPDAVAVVNPNQGHCLSGLGHLCGAGVIFYLLLGLRRAMIERGLVDPKQFDPKSVLDLFAIGTVIDLVPLIDENRVLVKHGLQLLARTDRPGLSELMKALEMYGRPLTALDLGMRLAPKLNALSRMGSDLRPLDLLIETDRNKAKDCVQLILDNNKVRQGLQQQAIDDAILAIDADQTREAKDPILVVHENFHRGVVGLVATRLTEKYQVPAFVGSIEDGEIITGSARVPRGSEFHLLEAMRAGESHLVQFGGHKQAAGFEMRTKEVEAFRLSLKQYSGNVGSENRLPNTDESILCDLSEVNESLMAWLDQLEPFGVGFPLPLFRVQDVLVTRSRFLKGEHLKLTLAADGAKALEAIWFSPAEPELALVGNRVDVTFELQWNYFRGTRTLQALISELKLSRS